MLCCVGLFAGLAVGQSLGGPWTVIAPAAGFGVGFLADMKMMKRMHHHGPAETPPAARSAPEPASASSDAPLAAAGQRARDPGPA